MMFSRLFLDFFQAHVFILILAQKMFVEKKEFSCPKSRVNSIFLLKNVWKRFLVCLFSSPGVSKKVCWSNQRMQILLFFVFGYCLVQRSSFYFWSFFPFSPSFWLVCRPSTNQRKSTPSWNTPQGFGMQKTKNFFLLLLNGVFNLWPDSKRKTEIFLYCFFSISPVPTSVLFFSVLRLFYFLLLVVALPRLSFFFLLPSQRLFLFPLFFFSENSAFSSVLLFLFFIFYFLWHPFRCKQLKNYQKHILC